MTKILAILILCFSLFLFPLTVKTDMSGGNFRIYADTFSSMDDSDSSSGGGFELFGTVGEGGATNATGGTFTLRGGFQAMELGAVSVNLSENTINFGQLDTGVITSSSLVATITADSGYTLTATEDGNLRSGANDIDDVVAGNIAAGTEAYGVQTTGDDGQQNAAAVALSGNSLTLASNAGQVSAATTTVNFLISVSNNTLSGNYAHTVTFSVTSAL